MKRIASGLIVSLIIFSAFTYFVPQARGTSPTVAKYSIPIGTNPISLSSDGVSIYEGSNSNGSVYKVAQSDGSFTKLSGITGTHNWMATYFYKDPLLNPTLYMIDSATNGGGLYAYDLTKSTLSLVSFDNTANNIASSLGQMLVGGQCPIVSYNFTTGKCSTNVQYFWYTIHQDGSNARFDKIEYLKDVDVNNPDQYHNAPYTCATNSELCNLSGPYPGLAIDSSGNVYITDKGDGCIIEYVATSNSMAKYCGFNSPAGIAINGNNAYIAQNMLNGGIVNWNTQTHTTTQTYTTTGATPFSVAVVSGTIVWASNGSDGNICTLSGVCVTTGEVNYYLLPLAGGKVAAGYLGSSGILIATGLISSSGSGGSSSVTTSTSTSTFITTISGTTSTATSTFVTTITNTQSNTQIQYGNGRQRIPSVIVNSTLGYEITTYNGTFTVGGFQYFPIGAASDFIAAQKGTPFCRFSYDITRYLAGCIFRNPQFYTDTAISNFNGMASSVDVIRQKNAAYWSHNATHLWEGDPSRNPQAFARSDNATDITVSDVKYGTLCTISGDWKDAKIQASPFDCRGLGLLIKYETFKQTITLPPPTVFQTCTFTTSEYISSLTEKVCFAQSYPSLVRISAVGTNSADQVAYVNVLIHDNRVNYYTVNPTTLEEFRNG